MQCVVAMKYELQPSDRENLDHIVIALRIITSRQNMMTDLVLLLVAVWRSSFYLFFLFFVRLFVLFFDS